jgi:putative FmdB family regulatory protein
MPLYTYMCNKCNEVSDHIHGMNVIATNCPICNSENTLSKVISSFFSKIENNKTVQPGSVVNETIKETQEELREVRNILKNRSIETIRK